VPRTFLRRVKRLLRRLGRSVERAGADTVLRLLARSAEHVGADIVLLDTTEEEQIRQKAYWEWMAERHLGLLLKQLEVDCVLDVGANVGNFAAMIRRAGWCGPIISFEPQTSCRELLEARAALDPTWSVLPVALSDREGTVRLTLRASSTFTSLNEPRFDSVLAAKPGFREKLEVVGHEDVPLRRLDTLLNELSGSRPERIFLKIDTQGHDEAVIAGASSILHRVIALQLELTQDPLYQSTSHCVDVMSLLHRSGFSLNATFPVTRDAQNQAMLEFDGLFVRSGVREALNLPHCGVPQLS
jgi:FkbM family methyltransferase